MDAHVFNDFPLRRRADDGRVEVELGDLVAGQELTLVVAVRCERRGAGELAHLSCRVDHRDDIGHRSTDIDDRKTARPVWERMSVRVDWTAASAAENDAQPVSRDVLLAVGRQLAARARADALDANRRGDFARADAILEDAGKVIREMAAGIKAMTRLADEVVSEKARYGTVMASMDLKEEHFASYSALRGRDRTGKARKPSINEQRTSNS